MELPTVSDGVDSNSLYELSESLASRGFRGVTKDPRMGAITADTSTGWLCAAAPLKSARPLPQPALALRASMAALCLTIDLGWWHKHWGSTILATHHSAWWHPGSRQATR